MQAGMSAPPLGDADIAASAAYGQIPTQTVLFSIRTG